MDEQNKIQYGEINITDYIKVILKRKRLISLVFLAFLIVGGVYAFFISPKVYQIDSTLEVGKINGNSIKDPNALVEKINTNNNLYSDLVSKKLNIPMSQYPGINAKFLDGSDLITLSIKDSRKELAKNVLGELLNLILADHSALVKFEKDLINQDIGRVKDEIALSQSDEKILEDKESALEKLYPYNYLTQQVSGSLFTLLDTREKLNSKKEEVNNLYPQIDSLQRSLENIQESQVVSSPTISESPIKPQPIILTEVAGLLGLFLGVFLAFFKEWWEKNKR